MVMSDGRMEMQEIYDGAKRKKQHDLDDEREMAQVSSYERAVKTYSRVIADDDEEEKIQEEQ